MLIVFIIIFIALYELITVMYYESLKIRLVKVLILKATGIKKGMPTQQSWRSARNCKFRVSD